MAVSQTTTKRSLVLTMDNGVDAKGKPVTKNYTYAGIKIGAEAEKIMALAHALSALSAHNLVGVKKKEKAVLVGE